MKVVLYALLAQNLTLGFAWLMNTKLNLALKLWFVGSSVWIAHALWG